MSSGWTFGALGRSRTYVRKRTTNASARPILWRASGPGTLQHAYEGRPLCGPMLQDRERTAGIEPALDPEGWSVRATITLRPQVRRAVSLRPTTNQLTPATSGTSLMQVWPELTVRTQRVSAVAVVPRLGGSPARTTAFS